MPQDFYHKHMTQVVKSDPYWQYNCAAYACAMMITDATLGGVSVTGRIVRAWSNEPIPDKSSPGLRLEQCENVAWQFRVRLTDMQGHTWAEAQKAVDEGRRVHLLVDYETLAGARCQANGDFGHSLVLLRDAQDDAYMRGSDPLCSESKRYKRDVLQDAAQKFARESGQKSGLRWAMTRQIPLLVK